MIIKYVLLLSLVLSCTACELYKSLRYGGLPNQGNYKHFHQRKVNNGGTPFHFYSPNHDYGLGKHIGLTDRDLNATNVSLDSFTQLHKTVSFLIIRNDTVLYERYQKGYTDTSLVSSFSMVKPIVTTLIGIAIQEGKIKSDQDFLVDYLPEFKAKPGWDKIRITHLLRHTSGIKFTDKKLDPTSDNAEFYWGDDLREEALELSVECAPDTKFRYSSENTLLLGLILEKVTGGTVSQYLEDKLWRPLGMEAPASWSLDNEKTNPIEKVFCCLQARTIDFAKFGRLYLNGGNWNGQQIVPKAWVDYATHADPHGNNRHFYNYNWGIGPAKYGSFFAVGLYGQYLYIYPEKHIIIVRFGKAEVSYSPNYWQGVFLQILDQM